MGRVGISIPKMFNWLFTVIQPIGQRSFAFYGRTMWNSHHLPCVTVITCHWTRSSGSRRLILSLTVTPRDAEVTFLARIVKPRYYCRRCCLSVCPSVCHTRDTHAIGKFLVSWGQIKWSLV